jgi:hypothetical protein
MTLSRIIADGIIKWEPCAENDVICARFSFDEWHRIVADIHSDEEWFEFLKENPDFVRCFVLKRCDDCHSIAFIYLLKEYDDERIISIHGGGWESPLMHYRGYILMIRHLLCQGYKVRTYCKLSNLAAIRFDRSVGFVPYRYTEEEVFMWITLRRLEKCKFYKRFYDENSRNNLLTETRSRRD